MLTIAALIGILFPVIAIGSYLGKIKIHGISFGLAAVLLCAVAAGWLISVLPFPMKVIDPAKLKNSLKSLSKIGTALFISTVGISAGYSPDEEAGFKKTAYFFYGAAVVITGFLLVKGILLLDRTISASALLGLLCGALTSTPGMSAASEKAGITAEEVALGYGSAYLFGVLFTVFFVQLLTRDEEKDPTERKGKRNIKKTSPFPCLIQIGMTAILGTRVGQLCLPPFGVSLGSSGGMLIIGLLCGWLIRRYFPNAVQPSGMLAFFRNAGLVFFLACSGIPAGMQLCALFDPKWLLYGILFTIGPSVTAYALCRLLRHTKTESATVIAGGMTSTPAVGVLTGRGVRMDLSAYSIVYLGALMTMVIGIRLLPV